MLSLAGIVCSYTTITNSNLSVSISGNTIHGNNNIISALSDISMGSGSKLPSVVIPPSSSPSVLPPPPLNFGENDPGGLQYSFFRNSSTTSPDFSSRREYMQLLYPQTYYLQKNVKTINNASTDVSNALYNTFIYPVRDSSSWQFPQVSDTTRDEDSKNNDGEAEMSMWTLMKSSSGNGNTMVHPATIEQYKYVISKYPLKEKGDSQESIPGAVSGGNALVNIGRRKLGIVQPVDDRDQLECGRTSQYAWSTIVSIGGYCTGTLVSPDTVMTAGHCIYDTGADRWMEPPYIEVHPCSSSDSATQYGWTRMRTFRGWTRSGLRGWDAGIIKLDGNAGLLDGWKSFGYSSALSLSWTWNLAGYPGDKPFQTMWTDYDGMCTSSHHSDCSGNPFSQTYLYRMDTRGGQSGSGVYIYRPNHTPKRIIYGIHTSWSGASGDTATDTSYNRASRIRPSIFNSFCDFIDNGAIC